MNKKTVPKSVNLQIKCEKHGIDNIEIPIRINSKLREGEIQLIEDIEIPLVSHIEINSKNLDMFNLLTLVSRHIEVSGIDNSVVKSIRIT